MIRFLTIRDYRKVSFSHMALLILFEILVESNAFVNISQEIRGEPLVARLQRRVLKTVPSICAVTGEPELTLYIGAKRLYNTAT